MSVHSNTYPSHIKFVLDILKPLFPKLSLILFMVFVWTMLETLVLYTLRIIINNFDNNIFYNEWSVFFTIFVLLVLLIETSMRVANFIHTKLLPRASFLLRQNLTTRLLNKDLLFFNGERVGTLASKISELSVALEGTIKTIIYGVLAGSFNFFITAVLIGCNLSWLAVYFLVWYILMLAIGILYTKNILKLSDRFAYSLNNSTGELVDILQNILSVKISAKEAMEEDRIKQRHYSVLEQSQIQMERLLLKTDTIRSIISALLLIGLFGFSLLKVIVNEVSLGDLVFVTSAAFIVRRDIWRVSLQITEVYKDFGFLKEISQLIDQRDKHFKKETKHISDINNIRLDSVYFGYPNQENTLKNISVELKYGEKIALVGPSGAGKSTLAKILQGLYSFHSGNLLINNDRIQDLFLSSIIKHVTYIAQEPIFFNRSIKENICYFSNHLDQTQLDKAIKIALCEDFINKLPDKIDTILSNLGNSLSAGQKQRIAIARAIYSKLKWIILDEPSSALDPATESILIRNLLKYFDKDTLIIITHNPEIIKVMNKVLFLKDGYLISQGSHDALIEECREYKNFFNRKLDEKKDH